MKLPYIIAIIAVLISIAVFAALGYKSGKERI